MNKASVFFAAFTATAAATVAAATVTLAPPAGTTTNALALFTGDTSVEIAGSGTVRLNNANSHTGGTTLSGGTLAISGNIPAGSRSPVGAGTFTVSGGTLLGSGTFGGNITVTGTTSIKAPDGWTLTGNNAFSDRVDLVDGSLTIAGGTVTLDAKHFQLSPTNNANTTFAMTGGAFNANGRRIIAGFRSTYATNVTDISGTAAVTNSEYCYTYEGAGNYWALNVHDGGLFATKGSLYANGSGAVMDISVSNGGVVRANKITSTGGSTTAASVTDGGILGITEAIQAKGTTTLSIDGGIVRNDSTVTDVEYFQFFQADAADLTVAIGPKGGTFRGGGKTAKFAQLYKDMSAIPAGAGETAQGVTFDGGSWAYYTTQSYEGPTVIGNGASLFLSGAGALPNSSVVTVGANSELRIGNTDKSVASLTIGEGAILGFGSKTDTPPRKLVVSEAITLSSNAKVAIYSANTPVASASNTAGTYTVLQVPAAYADALRAVKWSCAKPASGKVYSFSVETSGSTATLSMTIADAASADDAVATGGGYGAVGWHLNVDRVIGVRGILNVPGDVYGTASDGSVHSLTIYDGGSLFVTNGTIRPIQDTDYSFDLYLENGGSIIVRSIEDKAAVRDTNQTGTPRFHFNGGTIYPVWLNYIDGNRFYLNDQPATIGEHGLTIDLAKWERPDGFTWASGTLTSEWVRASVQGHVNHDPNCDGDDGGITVRGIKGDKSLVLFGGRFAGSTLTGGIRAEDGATVGATANSLEGQTLFLAPGSRFRPYNNTSTLSIGNLTFGDTNATEPVALDGSNAKTNYNIVVTGTLDVRSPVAYSVCAGWEKDSSADSGVYTALVYQASCNVDPSLFQLPAGYAGSLTANEVTLSGGDYAGWKALVVTIDNDLVVTGATKYPTPKTFSSDTSCGAIVVGGSWNGVADPVSDTSLTVTGDITVSTGLYLGYNPAPGADAATGAHQAFFTLDGGTIRTPFLYSVYRPGGNGNSDCRFGSEATVNDGLLDIAGDIRFGYNRTKYGDKLYSRLTVNGGRVAVGGKVTLYWFYQNSGTTQGDDQFSTPGSLVVNGGEVDVKGKIDLSRSAYYNSSYTSYTECYGLYLNGGVLKAENITMYKPAAKPKFYFNGGTYAPYGANSANRTMENLYRCYVSTNGAIVSTENLPAGETYTIAQPLLTDPALSGAADGGLVKKGAGTLALSGANTFTGLTKVESGTLAASAASAISDDVEIADGATLDFGGADASIPSVAASGAVVGNLTVTDAIVLGGNGSILSVEGNLTLGDHAAIDFGLGEGEEPSSDWMPVAAVSGTIKPPATLRARNCGPMNRCETQVIDGVLYAKPANASFTIIIR